MALALWLCIKEFPQRREVVKQVRYLLGRNRMQYVWIDIQGYSESHTLMVV